MRKSATEQAEEKEKRDIKEEEVEKEEEEEGEEEKEEEEKKKKKKKKEKGCSRDESRIPTSRQCLPLRDTRNDRPDLIKSGAQTSLPLCTYLDCLALHQLTVIQTEKESNVRPINGKSKSEMNRGSLPHLILRSSSTLDSRTQNNCGRRGR